MGKGDHEAEQKVIKKQKSKKLWILISIPIVVLAIIGGILFYRNTPEQRIKRQIALGDRYMDELDYEKAVAAYKAALEIDPSRDDVTVLVGTAYVQWGNALLGTQERERAYEAYENAKEYGMVEDAEYGMVSCVIMEAEELYSQGRIEYAISRLKEIEAYYTDSRIADEKRILYIAWADELRAEGNYEKEIDILFEFLNDQAENEILDRLLESFYRYIDTLLPGDEDDPDIRQKIYTEIIALWDKWANLLKKLGMDYAETIARICREEADKYRTMYQRCYQEKKLYAFRNADAAGSDEYEVILATIRARYGTAPDSINIVKDDAREAENKKPGLKEVFVQYTGNKAVTVFNEKYGADTQIAKTYLYDLYLVNLDEKTIKQFKHGEYVQYGGGSEKDVDGELIHYTYSGNGEIEKKKEIAKNDFVKWFVEKTNAEISDKEICIYYFGEEKIKGWNGDVVEWRIAFIASDDRYYEVYYYSDGTKKWMTCSESGGSIMRKDEKWE